VGRHGCCEVSAGLRFAFSELKEAATQRVLMLAISLPGDVCVLGGDSGGGDAVQRSWLVVICACV
jgi:hypothetical protein